MHSLFVPLVKVAMSSDCLQIIQSSMLPNNPKHSFAFSRSFFIVLTNSMSLRSVFNSVSNYCLPSSLILLFAAASLSSLNRV